MDFFEPTSDPKIPSFNVEFSAYDVTNRIPTSKAAFFVWCKTGIIECFKINVSPLEPEKIKTLRWPTTNLISRSRRINELLPSFNSLPSSLCNERFIIINISSTSLRYLQLQITVTDNVSLTPSKNTSSDEAINSYDNELKIGTENTEDSVESEDSWENMSTNQKALQICMNIVKTLCVLGFLYFFICSLELLSSSFTLIAGKSTGSLVENESINNPIVGLMIGILLTVLVQSSSTSTSIIVSMVASGILTVNEAIPIIMGSNIGTSVTSTLVSFVQITNKENFRRSFSGATVHDMFNWLCVLVLLPLEVVTGFLEFITGKIVSNLIDNSGAEINFLETITSVFTSLIIQLDSVIIECWGLGFMLEEDSMITEFCHYTVNVNTTTSLPPESAHYEDSASNPDPLVPFVSLLNHSVNSFQSTLVRRLESDGSNTSFSTPDQIAVLLVNSSDTKIPDQCVMNESIIGIPDCKFLFYQTQLVDSTVGVILLCIALFILIGSLLCIVKILNSLLQGSIRKLVEKSINSDIPYVPWLTGYVAIIVGGLLTFIVQSSSVFTSTLVPLVGMGIITVERMYPLTLGSNVGTTTTTLLAAMAVVGDKSASIQVALVHLFFNLCGIALYYPIPLMRFPIPLCKALGNVTADHRWFAIFYLIAMFLLLPGLIFALSLGGPQVLWGVLVSILLILLCILLTNILQKKAPSWLPSFLRTWEFLPEPLRSLDPYDRVITSMPCCKKCRDISYEDESATVEKGRDNGVFFIQDTNA